MNVFELHGVRTLHEDAPITAGIDQLNLILTFNIHGDRESGNGMKRFDLVT